MFSQVYVVNHELENPFHVEVIQVYEYVHRVVVDVLMMMIHHQILAEINKKMKSRKKRINHFTRRRINSSDRNIVFDGLGKIFDVVDDAITKGSRRNRSLIDIR